MEIIISLFAAVLFTAIAELILSSIVAPWYFTKGLRIFHETVHLSGQLGLPVSASQLESLFPTSAYTPLMVKEVGACKFAVREKVLFFPTSKMQYTTLMRGLITIDPITRSLTFDGLLNYYPVFFSVLMILFVSAVVLFSQSAMSLGSLIFPVFLFFLWRHIYYIQSERFRAILKAVSNASIGAT